MRVVLTAQVDAPDDAAIVAVLGDLSTYPRWLRVVTRVEPDGSDAWTVDIGARVGLLSQSKRVRMVRVGPMRFERDEADGAEHPSWVLDAAVTDGAVRVELFYGGRSLAVAALEPLLRLEAARAPARLAQLVRGV